MSTEERVYRIKRMIERWEYLVTSYGWKFDILYCDCGEEMPEGSSQNCLAITFMEFKYLHAQIYFNLHKSETVNDDELEGAVIHELTHLLLSPLQEENTVQSLEYCTTTISRLFKGLRDANSQK